MKRKASKKLSKAVEEESQIASLVTQIVSEGDLQLDFSKDLSQPLGLLVSRYTLCLSSPVFKTMFSDDSRWCKSTKKTFNTDGIQVVRLEDDDFGPMEIIMNVIHLQGSKVPPVLLFPELDLCARLCDKYDLGGSLGGWPEIWMKPYLLKVDTPGFARWLFISSIFKQDNVFITAARHLLINTTLSDNDELLYEGSSHYSEGVPTSTLAWLSSTRAEVIRKLLQLCWEARNRACKFRGTHGMNSEAEACEALNLGHLSRQFPYLCEPTKTSKSDPRSVTQIHDAIRNIRHIQGMSGLEHAFAARHGGCDVGQLLQPKADACVHAVQGRTLSSASFNPPRPMWINNMVADLRSSYPNARIRASMYETLVPSLTDAVFRLGTTHGGNHVRTKVPLLRCLDCVADIYVIPRPTKICSEFEEHLKSNWHLRQVQRRLDAAGVDAQRREVEEKMQ